MDNTAAVTGNEEKKAEKEEEGWRGRRGKLAGKADAEEQQDDGMHVWFSSLSNPSVV